MTQRRAPYRVGNAQSGEDELAMQIKLSGLPEPDRQYPVKFPGMRQPYRLDFAWPIDKICAEVQGGTWANGRHTRGSGYEHDRRRQNRLQLNGWLVLEFTTGMVHSGEALSSLQEIFVT